MDDLKETTNSECPMPSGLLPEPAEASELPEDFIPGNSSASETPSAHEAPSTPEALSTHEVPSTPEAGFSLANISSLDISPYLNVLIILFLHHAGQRLHEVFYIF